MNNAPALSIAHLLGLPKKAAPPAKHLRSRPLPVLTGPFAKNVASASRRSRKLATASSDAPLKAAKPVKAPSFAHLLAAPDDSEYADEAPTGQTKAKASAIVAAAAKARSVIPVTRPAKDTVAAAILAAAQVARTPTGTRAPKTTGMAAAILAAGRKRRGEV
jgi:hypothetical protein